MYKEALLNNYRYKTSRGEVDTEQLFSIKLRSNNNFNLDVIAQTIAEDTEKEGKHSFVTPTKTNDLNVKKLAIVKDIISDKLAKENAIQREREIKEKENKLLEIIARKQNESLEAKPEEELIAELEALRSQTK